MSKECEGSAYVEALNSLPTMSQFTSKSDCEGARLEHMFTAGRALGRREMKGEAVKVARAKFKFRMNGREIAEAIEAIPEEV